MLHSCRSRLIASTIATFGAACGSDAPMAPINALVALDGLNQVAATGDVLAAPVTVHLIRSDGSVAGDAEVSWTLDTGAGALAIDAQSATTSSVISVTTRTSSNGKASVWWRLPALEGDYKLTVAAVAAPAVHLDVSAKAIGVLAMRYDGSHWLKEIVDTGATFVRPALIAITGIGGSNVLTVGTHCVATNFQTPTTFLLLRTAGSTWNANAIVWTSSFDTWTESAAAACPSAPISSAGVTTVAARSANDVFMLTRTRVSQEQQWQIRHFDGTAWTSQLTYGAGLTPYGPLNGIWLAANNGAYAVTGFSSVNTGTTPNEGGTIKHYDGTSWTTVYADGSKGFNGVWGTSAADVTVVGTSGTILHFDGSSWTPHESGTSAELRALDGIASTFAVAVGDVGTILRYNGNAWIPQQSGTTATLRAVRVISPTSAFAVGNGGIVVRYDGSSWTPTIANAGISFTGVWGLSTDRVYAVGTPAR